MTGVYPHDPLEELLRLVESLSPSGYLGDGMRAQMQDYARQVRVNIHFLIPDHARSVIPPQRPSPLHTRERQSDEIACSCGRRWGVDEVAPACD